MTERFQTGVHPDADQISLFLEGAATTHERAQMLEHLTGCAECREMVFLAQGEAEPVTAAGAMTVSEPRPARWWRRGWIPFGLAGAALASALVLVVYLRQPGAPVGERQIARVEAPAANGPRPEVMQKAEAPAQENRASQGVDRPSERARKAAPGGGSGAGNGMGAGNGYSAAQVAPALAANEQVMEAARGNMARLQQNVVSAPAPPPPPAAVAPAPATAPAADSWAQQQQPIVAAKAGQGGPAATQQYSLAGVPTMGRNLAALEVLHDVGLGEVSGLVTDASGAAIGEASVSLNDGADKAVREVATGPDGRFRIADVPAGKYELRVSARGFNTRLEPVELKGSQVAKLDSVLTVGTASQTVTVETNNAAIAMQQPEVTGANVLQDDKLPGGAMATVRVALGGRMLSVDAAGDLYLSWDSGKSWKKVKPRWTGKADRIAVVPADGGQVFEMTTDAGVVWTSEDGKHWRARTDGKR